MSARPPGLASRPAPRLASLDVLRGLTIVGMIVVNTAAYLHAVSGYAQFASLERRRGWVVKV